MKISHAVHDDKSHICCRVRNQNLNAELVSFRIDHPCLKVATLSMPLVKFTIMDFLGDTKIWSDFDMSFTSSVFEQ